MSAGNYGVVCIRCFTTGGGEIKDCETCYFHLARLREQYAGMAMQALIALVDFNSETSASYAVKTAYELIAELTKESNK